MTPDLDLLTKQYKVMLEALNDIKDVINTDPITWQKDVTTDDFCRVLAKIETLAADASPIDLFNPHNKPGQARTIIDAMKEPSL